MHFTDTVEQFCKHGDDEFFTQRATVLADMLLHGASPLQGHDHVSCAIGAKKIYDANDMGVIDATEHACFFKKIIQAALKLCLMLCRNIQVNPAFAAHSKALRDVFLDCPGLPIFIMGEVNNGKSAR